MDTLIRNGRVIDPSQNIDGQFDVLIRNGKIEAIDKDISFSGNVIDATGLVVTPGWIDIHTHLRDPGFTHKEDMLSGSRAAAAGGFTSIACMANTKPVNDSATITKYIVERAKEVGLVNIFPIGSITINLDGKELSDMKAMSDAGAVGFSDDGKTVMDANLLMQGMLLARDLGKVIISHCEDSCLKGKGVMNEGAVSKKLGLTGISNASEEIIVSRDIQLSKLTGCKLHIAHASTAKTIEMVSNAKQEGLVVTCEVTPHHLNLNDEAAVELGTMAKVAPPLRNREDQAALKKALSQGKVDCLASDHAPHAHEDKCGSFDAAEFGMIGLETAFALYYQMVIEKHITLNEMVAAMTHRPAKVIGVKKGSLQQGWDADVTLFDPNAAYQINHDLFFSKSRNTPFQGLLVQGKVMLTIVGGKVVFPFAK